MNVSKYECFVKGKDIIKINEEYIPHKRGKGKLIKKIRRKLRAHQKKLLKNNNNADLTDITCYICLDRWVEVHYGCLHAVCFILFEESREINTRVEVILLDVYWSTCNARVKCRVS
jgi:hypothetical protein